LRRVRDRFRLLPIAPLLKRGAWGLPDQALLSGTNFLTTVLIARALSPERFGEFALAIAFINMAMSLGSATLTQPFVVLSARRQDKQYRQFLAATLLAQFLFVATTAVPIMLAAGISGALGWRLAGLILMIAPAMAAWQVQEFVRQVFYAEGRLQAAFTNDIISYGGQTAGFMIAFSIGVLSPILGLGILALTSLLAVLVGLWSLRGSIEWSFSLREFIEFMRETWGYGQWLLGSVVLGAISGFSMFFMLATFSGAAAVGVFRALITTSAPVRVLVEGTRTSFVPSAARVVEQEGLFSLKSYVRRLFILVGPIVVCYCLFASVFSEPILNVLYGDRFADYAWLLPLFMIAFFFEYITFAIEIGLLARRVTGIQFQVSVFGSITTVILGPILVYFFGLTGLAALHVILAPMFAAMFWMRYRREIGYAMEPSSTVMQQRARA